MKKETGKKTGKKVVKKSEPKIEKAAKETVEVKSEKVVTKVSEKINKKTSETCKLIRLGTLILSIILIIIGIFVKAENASMILKLIGTILLGVIGIIYAINSQKHVLIKSVCVVALIAILLTWLLPYGYFQGATFTDYGMNRIGINDLPTVFYYSVYFALDKIIFLLAMAGFYGLLSKTDGYKKIISDIAKSVENHKVLFGISTLVIVTILTSLFSQTMAVVFFIPFIISILSKLKYDKLSAFVLTFGGILAGMIGSPWGTEGLYWFNYYASLDLSNGFTLRIIIAALTIVLFILFALLRLRKAEKKENYEVVEDVFEIGEPTRNAKKWPMAIILSITALFVVLGYINWSTNFGITIFNDFHTWLTGLTIGKDFAIFSSILGKNAIAFGNWDVVTLISLILVMSILIALINRIKLSDFLTFFGEGFKKMIKPIGLFVSVFVVFVIAYTSPFMPTINNWFLSLIENFNPYLTSIIAFITSVFHADFGFTGYTIGGYLSSTYANNIAIADTIYFSMYGLVQVLAPTSGLLLLGLCYTKVEYKSWLKYIWKFAIIILLVLLVTFGIATYA